MKVNKSHKIRLCPNNKQINYLVRCCGVVRFTYNWALTEWKRQYEAGEKPSSFALKKTFNSIKKSEFPFVLEVTKCAAEHAFVNLGTAFKNFFRNIKEGKKLGYPQYKRKGVRDSFYISNDKIRFNGKKVRIPKLGWVRVCESLRFEGKILSAVVSKIADKWFVSVSVEQEISVEFSKGEVIGVDVGIKNLATTSDGRIFENPRALKQAEQRLRMYQKSVSRKVKSSNNRKKALLKLQRQHYKVSCVRSDAIHKASSAITKGAKVVGIESLNVAGMLKNRRLSKALSDASMSELHRQIVYKAAWGGIPVIKADRFYPSSKKCSGCGAVKQNLTLSDRTYSCDFCGLETDRDLNAAINLKNMAVGSTVTACRPTSSGFGESRSETGSWAGISHRSVR